MAKKQISRKRKKQLKEPDEFITFSSKILNLVLENKNQAISVLSVFLLLILMLIGIKSYFVKSENRVFTDMAQSMAEYRALETAGTNNAILQKVDNDLSKILDKYSAMKAKKFAKIELANISFQSKKFERAIELYIDAINDFSDAPSIKNLVLNSLACSYEEKNDYKSAASYFELIVSGDDLFMKDEALFNLGRLYAAMGNNDKSKDAFVNIKENYPDSLYIELVKERGRNNFPK